MSNNLPNDAPDPEVNPAEKIMKSLLDSNEGWVHMSRSALRATIRVEMRLT